MENGKSLNGLLLVDKPKGWTSHDVVAKVRGTLRQSLVTSRQSLETEDQKRMTPLPKVKVGHTGTLDPAATGLMVLVVGSYCKRASEFSKLDKTYGVTMRLGMTSSTGDEEGQIVVSGSEVVDRKKVGEALQSFVGEIEQVPPAYSAIKVNGKRAYKLARAGKEVKLEPRKVRVYSIQLTDYSYPFIKLSTEVSSGTYIRSLVEDIGKKLGTGAYLTELKRTSVGEFSLKDSQKLTELNIDKSIIT